jgi:hypothetical protein
MKTRDGAPEMLPSLVGGSVERVHVNDDLDSV